ncbi:MAG TPA: polyhydroxyalkanoate synthesis regulator DNA-binding domain-containing protein [Kofleriaceae bacterium]
MSEARIIKRYANRKLYDTQHSRYVTLDQIAEMIRGGDDVKIVDNKTKEDLTSVTLAQIIFEEEKRQKSFLPLQAMRNIIQSGGESISQLVNQAKGRVSQILPRKKDEDRHEDEPAGEAAAAAPEPEPLGDDEEDGGDGAGGPNGPNGTDEATGGSRVREGLRNLREFREFLTSSQKAIDDWQRKVDGRIRHMFEGMSPFSTLQKDIGALSSRIAQLEAKLSQLVHEEHARDE